MSGVKITLCQPHLTNMMFVNTTKFLTFPTIYIFQAAAPGVRWIVKAVNGKLPILAGFQKLKDGTATRSNRLRNLYSSFVIPFSWYAAITGLGW